MLRLKYVKSLSKAIIEFDWPSSSKFLSRMPLNGSQAPRPFDSRAHPNGWQSNVRIQATDNVSVRVGVCICVRTRAPKSGPMRARVCHTFCATAALAAIIALDSPNCVKCMQLCLSAYGSHRRTACSTWLSLWALLSRREKERHTESENDSERTAPSRMACNGQDNRSAATRKTVADVFGRILEKADFILLFCQVVGVSIS